MPWSDKNLLSLAMLNNVMERERQTLISRCRIATEAWNELARVNESKSNPNQLHSKEAQHSQKMQPDQPVSTLITEFQLILDQLAIIVQTISDGEALICLLQSLSDEYQIFVRSMRISESLHTDCHKQSHA